MKPLYFITSNDGKIHEAIKKLYPLGYDIKKKNLGYPEIQTEHLEDVARYGVNHIQRNGIQHPFILEDAGIFIDALQGFPGVYSSYVYHTIGLDGIISLMQRYSKKTAVFKSVFAYAEPKGKPALFIGICKGTIIKEKKGVHGFGYDPIFIPDGSDNTFAEMKTSEKNKHSHRGKSLDKLYEYLQKRINTY